MSGEQWNHMTQLPVNCACMAAAVFLGAPCVTCTSFTPKCLIRTAWQVMPFTLLHRGAWWVLILLPGYSPCVQTLTARVPARLPLGAMGPWQQQRSSLAAT